MIRPGRGKAKSTAALIALVAALALAGCGVKGAPEPPPAKVGPDGEPLERTTPNGKPDRPFVLDRLLL